VINAAIIGLGWWGRQIVDVFAAGKKSDALLITHAVDVDPAAAGEFARSHNLVLLGDLAEALGSDAIDAVIITTPNSLHETQIIQAAGAGKHVFCEKPLCLTHAGAVRSVEACNKAGVVLGVGHERRFESAMVEAKRIVDAGELGAVMHVEASFNHDKLVDMKGDNWRASAVEAPAASLTATGVHLTDFFLHMFGPIAQVYAETAKWVMDSETGDSLSLQVRFDSGITGYINSILSTPLYSRFRVFGTKGWLEVADRVHPSEQGPASLTICRKEGEYETTECPPVDTVRVNIETFARAAAGGAPYPFTDQELIGNIAVFEAICRSVESGAAEAVGSFQHQ